MDSTLVLAAKGYELKETRSILHETGGDHLSEYPQLMSYYHTYFNASNMFSHKSARNFFIKKIGDILMDINPELFKEAVYESYAIYGVTQSELLPRLIHKLSEIPNDQLVLDCSKIGY